MKSDGKISCLRTTAIIKRNIATLTIEVNIFERKARVTNVTTKLWTQNTT